MRNLKEIEFESAGIETEASILSLESRIGVKLPSELRSHLLQFGGGYICDCIIGCKSPTPFGQLNVVQINTVDDILRTLDLDIVPRNLLCIGHGHLGLWTCISIAGVDHGNVFAFDSEMRYFWSRERIQSLPSLAPEVKDFFYRRDKNELPARPWGYENCYSVADSFDEFLVRLELAN